MQSKSEYFTSLSGDAHSRYEMKVLTTGLSKDPYSITEWTEEPSVIPDIKWSNFMIYIVSSPSPYTMEEINVICLTIKHIAV